MKKDKKFAWLPVSFLSVILILLGALIYTHHIVWIDNLPTPIKRKTPGFQESVSRLDHIKDIGWNAAFEQYPLTTNQLIQSKKLTCDTLCGMVQLFNRTKAMQKSMEEITSLFDEQFKEINDVCGKKYLRQRYTSRHNKERLPKPSKECCALLIKTFGNKKYNACN